MKHMLMIYNHPKQRFDAWLLQNLGSNPSSDSQDSIPIESVDTKL